MIPFRVAENQPNRRPTILLHAPIQNAAPDCPAGFVDAGNRRLLPDCARLSTPASFGELGWYRAKALVELRSRTPVYAGKQACDECHSDQLQKLAKF